MKCLQTGHCLSESESHDGKHGHSPVGCRGVDHLFVQKRFINRERLFKNHVITVFIFKTKCFNVFRSFFIEDMVIINVIDLAMSCNRNDPAAEEGSEKDERYIQYQDITMGPAETSLVAASICDDSGMCESRLNIRHADRSNGR